MNRREGASRKTGALIPVIVVAVLVVLAVILLFVWAPWDETEPNGIGNTVPELPGPEAETTPVTRMIAPAQDRTAWVASSPGITVGFVL